MSVIICSQYLLTNEWNNGVGKIFLFIQNSTKVRSLIKQNDALDFRFSSREEEQDDEDESQNVPLVGRVEKPGINGSLVFLYAIFFSMFTIGWVNLNSCSLNRLIPIYLIVAGFVGALAKFLSKFENKYIFNLSVVLVIFDILWHGLGTYVVYKEYQPNYDPTNEKPYCNRTAYLLAFWVLTFQYTLLGIFILLSACYMMMRGDFKKK